MWLALLLGSLIAQAKFDSFCVQNFNAYGPAYAPRILSRTDQFTRKLQTDACDLIHLQEAWMSPQINKIQDILKWDYKISAPNLLERVGVMSLYKGQGYDFETHGFGVNNQGGVLDGARDRLDVKKAFHVFVWRPTGVPEEIYAINTHLHPSSSSIRLTQVLDILRWRLDHLDRKVILTGDFNASPESLEMRVFKQALAFRDGVEDFWGTYPEGFCTYCRENRLSWSRQDKILDYVLLSNFPHQGQSSLVVEDALVNLKGAEGKPLSDHYGIRLQLKWVPQIIRPRALLSDSLAVLQEAFLVLNAEASPVFEVYKEFLKELILELQQSRGLYYRYLTFSQVETEPRPEFEQL